MGRPSFQSEGMPIRFLAIVDAQDTPVYFKSAEDATPEVAVNHQFIAEMSLDFVEQQTALLRANLRKPILVLLHDGIAVYAMLSNTKTKYLVGLNSNMDGTSVGMYIRALADAYVSYQCNPFGSKEGPIKSIQFDEKMLKLMQSSA